jgi:antitoxin PrlF
MPSAIVTSKGQITIPIEVRRALKIKPGVRIDFYESDPGHFSIIAKTGSIRDLEGCIPKLGYVPTIEEMNEAVMDHVAELDAATKSDRPKKTKEEEAA